MIYDLREVFERCALQIYNKKSTFPRNYQKIVSFGISKNRTLIMSTLSTAKLSFDSFGRDLIFFCIFVAKKLSTPHGNQNQNKRNSRY